MGPGRLEPLGNATGCYQAEMLDMLFSMLFEVPFGVLFKVLFRVLFNVLLSDLFKVAFDGDVLFDVLFCVFLVRFVLVAASLSRAALRLELILSPIADFWPLEFELPTPPSLNLLAAIFSLRELSLLLAVVLLAGAAAV
jgi:hypothetical protein